MTATETPDFPPSLLDVALFYAAAGVDEAIGEEPVDRTTAPPPRPAAGPAVAAPRNPAASAARPAAAELPAAAAGPAPAPAIRPPAPAVVASAAEVEGRAARAARACQSVADLKAAIAAFDGCALKATATNTVIDRGTPGAPLMIIGEAPGRDEDLQGAPFVGESGQLLDRMLHAIGRDGANTYISNILFWRPPGNRDPSAEEIVACRPFIERLIELARPQVIACAGRFAAGTLLGTTQGINRIRGRWHDYHRGDLVIPAMPLLHPAYLLRQPGMKREAWRDMLALAARLEELA